MNTTNKLEISGVVPNVNNLKGSVAVGQSVSGSVSIDTVIKGISPTIVVEEIDDGHRLYITDVNGTQVFDILDGKSGNSENSNDGTLTDRTTGKKYTLYVDDGKLFMEKIAD